GGFMGYHRVGAEALAYSLDQETPPDLKESFSAGRPDLGDDPYFTSEQGRMYFRPTPWPAEAPAMQQTLVPLYRAFDRLALDVMRIFALALDLPIHFFDAVIDKGIGAVRALNYPEQKVKPVPGQLRAGAHTDYGTLTLLSMEDALGGLE